MAFSTPIHTNEQSIERVLRAGIPVVLVFWRKDCEPCAELNPVLERVATLYAGKALVAKVDTADNPQLVNRYNVASLPSLVVLRDGRVQAQATGAVPEVKLRGWLDAVLRGDTSAQAPTGTSVPLRSAPPPRSAPPSRPQPASRPEAANGATKPTVLTASTFDRTISQKDQPVVVDFWAPWCGPCRMIAPTIDRLAHDFAGKAVVAKLNIDEHPQIAQRYGIQSIPAVFIFRRGQVVDRLMGAQPAPVLRQALERQLG